MPNLTIYVDRELAEQVRRHDVAISRTCQAALRRQVRLAERRNPQPTVTHSGYARQRGQGREREPTA